MGIKGKALIVLLGVLVLLLAAVVPMGLIQYARIRDQTLDDAAVGFRSAVEAQLQGKSDVWLTNALQIAENPVVVEAMATGDRETLITILDRYNTVFKENTNFRNVQVHLIDAEQNSYVKFLGAGALGRVSRVLSRVSTGIEHRVAPGHDGALTAGAASEGTLSDPCGRAHHRTGQL
jgi:type II secretory pathway pseudopilin PulG